MKTADRIKLLNKGYSGTVKKYWRTRRVAIWHKPQNSAAVVRCSRYFFLSTLMLMPIQTFIATLKRWGYKLEDFEYERLLSYLGAKTPGVQWNGSVWVPVQLRYFVERHINHAIGRR